MSLGGQGDALRMMRKLNSFGWYAHGLIHIAWSLGLWEVVIEDGQAVVHALGLDLYGPMIPFLKMW